MKDLFVDMLSRFEVARLRLTAGRRKDGEIWGFPANCLGVGKFCSKLFKAWFHIKLVCKFRGDPLRDGWDPVSKNLGPKPHKEKVLRNNITPSQLSRRAAKNMTVFAIAKAIRGRL